MYLVKLIANEPKTIYPNMIRVGFSSADPEWQYKPLFPTFILRASEKFLESSLTGCDPDDEANPETLKFDLAFTSLCVLPPEPFGDPEFWA